MTHRLKITILGNSSTGKTSILNRIALNKFMTIPESTIGASFMSLKFDDIRYEIWDTAGQERYLSLTPMYYRNTNIIFLVFDLYDLNTIDRLLHYLRTFENALATNFRMIIIGNKLDLIDKKELDKIDKQLKDKIRNTKSFQYIHGLVDYIYISAKSGEKIEELVNKMKELGEKVVKENLSSPSYISNMTKNIDNYTNNQNINSNCRC